MNDALNCEALCQDFFNRRKERISVLRDVSLRVPTGQMLMLTGRSGAGKTTLLLACAGYRRPGSGVVTWAGTEPYKMNRAARQRFRAQHVGFVFQTNELIPYLSVSENVMLPPGATKRQMRWLAEQLDLENRIHHLPAELSQGERQRTSIMRALANEPRLVFADEPTGNLDDENSRGVIRVLRQFADQGERSFWQPMTSHRLFAMPAMMWSSFPKGDLQGSKTPARLDHPVISLCLTNWSR